VWGMIAGDSNSDGLINLDDKVSGWSPNAGKKLYHPSDLNLDTFIDNPDKNDWWYGNTNYQTQVPQ